MRRGPHPPPPEVQPVAQGEHRCLRGLPVPGHPGPHPAGGGGDGEAVRRGGGRAGGDREFQGPEQPRGQGSSAGVGPVL